MEYWWNLDLFNELCKMRRALLFIYNFEFEVRILIVINYKLYLPKLQILDVVWLYCTYQFSITCCCNYRHKVDG